MHSPPTEEKSQYETFQGYLSYLPNYGQGSWRASAASFTALCPLNPQTRAGTLSRCSINPSYLSPGISSRLVIPVQLMSRVWKQRAGGSGQSMWWHGHTHPTVARPLASLSVPSPIPHSFQSSLLPLLPYPSSTFSLTGRRIKNIDTAPTIGRFPMSGSRITRKTPCSWGRKRRTNKAFPQKQPSFPPRPPQSWFSQPPTSPYLMKLRAKASYGGP